MTSNDYLVATIVFWAIYVTIFIALVLYVVPAFGHIYKRVADIFHILMREYHRKGGYDGYYVRNNHLRDHYQHGRGRS